MKQIHAVLRLLICLFVTMAWVKQPPPASPEQTSAADAVTTGHLTRADAALNDVEARR